MTCILIGRTCAKNCGRAARASSDLCGLCHAGANALERVLDLFVWLADSPQRLIARW